MAIRQEAIEGSAHSAVIVQFPKIIREGNLPANAGDPDSDLYDSSREGTESFPQLARFILVKMVEDERIKAGRKKFDLTFVRERAADRFLEFVAGNSAMSEHLSVDDIARIIRRHPLTVSKYFESKGAKTA